MGNERKSLPFLMFGSVSTRSPTRSVQRDQSDRHLFIDSRGWRRILLALSLSCGVAPSWHALSDFTSLRPPMRTLAIAAGTCVAAYLLIKQLRSRGQAAEEEPEAECTGVLSGTSSQVVRPRAPVNRAEAEMTVLPESIESVNARPEKSPLRAFTEHAVTRRILSAVPMYFGGTFLLLGMVKGHGLISYASGILIGMGFPSTLWPTDQGVRSRSWFIVMTPLALLRAVLVSRVVYLEYMHAPVLTGISYLHGGYTIIMTWTLVVLNVRAHPWPCPPPACGPYMVPRSVACRTRTSSCLLTRLSYLLVGARQEPLEAHAYTLVHPPPNLPRRRCHAALHHFGAPRPLPPDGAGRRPLLRGGRCDANLHSASGRLHHHAG